jgi:ABC-type branched-subunit amino acid transport system substrate-binding protein
VAAAAIALAMVAAACTDNNKDTNGATTTNAASVTTAPATTSVATSSVPETYPPLTGDPIKIGTTIWASTIVVFNTRLPGIAAAVDYINAHGGVQGHPLEWVFCAAADANEGEACAQRMVAEGVVATVADANFTAEEAEVRILGEAGIPIIDSFLTTSAALSDPNVYEMCAPTVFEFAAIPPYMKMLDKKTMAIFYGDTSQAQDVMTVVQKAADASGVQIVAKVPIALGAVDYLPQVQATMDANADVNMAVLAPFMSLQALQAADQLGNSFHFGVTEAQFSTGDYAEYGQANGGLDGALTTGCVPPLTAGDQYPAIQQAVDNIALEADSGTYKDLDDGTGAILKDVAAPDKLTSYATRGWFATLAFWEATKQIQGDVTSASLKQVLATTTGLDVGLAEQWVPSHQGPAGYTSVSNAHVYLMTVKDGKSVLYQADPIDAGEAFQP